jgi:formylglycine-generating enzyme required for sulfatase activity
MGSSRAEDSLAFDNEQWSDGSGRRTVDLPAFYMARYEVTVAQFRAFVQESSFRATEEVLRGAGEQPVANVSWPDALAYVRWIDARLRGAVSVAPELSRMLNDGWRVSLPSEAQWEKAARGSDGRRYPWGNVARPGLANFRGSARHSVGSFACGECAFGLADMSGNVWEWTRTPYVPGPYQVAASPLNLEEDALWIMRGGSYTDEERNIRTSVRGGADPGARRPFIGFRLALTRL